MKAYARLFPALLALLTFLASPRLFAEYRAFLLKITQGAQSPQNEPAPFRLVKSSLDHLQYPDYYPLLPGEQIQYIDTWMCRGRTGGLAPVCASPKESQAAQSLESR